MISFVHGPDRLLARQAALAIATEIDPGGENTTWLDGRETTPERILAEVSTVSFFGAPRVMIVSDLWPRGGGDASGEADTREGGEGRRAAGKPGLDALLGGVPEGQCLILFEPTMSAAPAAIRAATPAVKIVAGTPPRGAALLAWMEETALGAGSGIPRHAAQTLAETLFPQTWDRAPNNPRFDRPPDLALLAHEIAKLALAAYPEPIGVEHIQGLSERGPDQRIFRFQDAALGGDLRTSMHEMERLEEAGEEPAAVLAQLLGQIELTTVAAAAGGADATAIARDLGTVTPARVSAVVSSARRQRTTAGEAVASAITVDRNLKTGRIRQPRGALHELVLALATSTRR